ncbi:MAG: sirohydrochlorin cobaltochelatase [Candidatus Magnetominusculus sp. LBB02]|nr:sirohydrochlorin cobaltochelatase [Candidatus Magnetominusculus sp. LBB02]
MKERKLKKRNLKDSPALVIASFGTASKAKAAYEIFDADVRAHFPDKHIVWAYTSEIVREKTGTPGVLQALASLEEHGYRRAAVQPLQIVPGTEYTELVEMCGNFPGLRVAMGETLLHRWQFVDEVIAAIEHDFITDGINIAIAHGTPLCADPANTLYQGLDAYFTHKFPNCYFATIDGMPSMDILLNKIAAARLSVKRARLIPLLYVSGLHVEKDLLADQNSLKARLQALGFEVDYLNIRHEGGVFVKSLGFYEEVRRAFINRIERAFTLLNYY